MSQIKNANRHTNAIYVFFLELFSILQMWQTKVCGLEVVSNFAKFQGHGNFNIAIVKFDAISSLCSHG